MIPPTLSTLLKLCGMYISKHIGNSTHHESLLATDQMAHLDRSRIWGRQCSTWPRPVLVDPLVLPHFCGFAEGGGACLFLT